MADRFGSERSPPSPSVSAATAAFAEQQGASSSGPGVDGPPGEVEEDARRGEEGGPIALSGEERARVNAAMARYIAQFYDWELRGASKVGGADCSVRSIINRRSTGCKGRLAQSSPSSSNLLNILKLYQPSSKASCWI